MKEKFSIQLMHIIKTLKPDKIQINKTICVRLRFDGRHVCNSVTYNLCIHVKEGILVRRSTIYLMSLGKTFTVKKYYRQL